MSAVAASPAFLPTSAPMPTRGHAPAQQCAQRRQAADGGSGRQARGGLCRGLDSGRAAAQAQFEAKLEEQRRVCSRSSAAERGSLGGRTGERLAEPLVRGLAEFESAHRRHDGAHPEALPRRGAAAPGDRRAAGQPRRLRARTDARRQRAHQRAGGSSRSSARAAGREGARRVDLRCRATTATCASSPAKPRWKRASVRGWPSSRRRCGERRRGRHQGARARHHPPREASGEEGGHHGGVWKIAYADFMTAMMAFFLVMWLINSTDKKVLTQVANYFNPMRLTDKRAAPARACNSIESGEQGKPASRAPSATRRRRRNAKEKARRAGRTSQARQGQGQGRVDAGTGAGAEGAGRTPRRRRGIQSRRCSATRYGVLARIAAEAADEMLRSPKPSAEGRRRVYRDPFDPAAQRSAPDQAAAAARRRPGRRPEGRAGQPRAVKPRRRQQTRREPGGVAGTKPREVAPAAGGEAKAPQRMPAAA